MPANADGTFGNVLNVQGTTPMSTQFQQVISILTAIVSISGGLFGLIFDP